MYIFEYMDYKSTYIADYRHIAVKIPAHRLNENPIGYFPPGLVEYVFERNDGIEYLVVLFAGLCLN